MSKKIFYNDHRYYGQELAVPYDGNILIDEEGYVEVSDKCAAELLGNPGWEDPAIVKEAPKAPKKKKGENAEWLKDVDLDQLATLSIEDLTELAVAGDIKGYEKFLKNQKAMAAFLKSKLNKLK